MKFWAILSKVLGYIWLVLALLLILAGTIGVWMNKGFTGVQELLNPFNVTNWIVMVVTLAPGIGLLMLAGKLQSKLHAGK
jgi:hypothetical protein